MSKEKLKPCPFCGDKDIIWKEDLDGEGRRQGTWFVFCNTSGCPCDIKEGNFHKNEQEAISAWNRRVG